MSVSSALNKPIATTERPAVDEWGIYDPDQAGLAAVLERLEARRRVAAAPNAQAMATSMRKASSFLRICEPKA